MYTRAKFAGRPIHRMLVAFPILLYVASFAAYFFYASGNLNVSWFRLACIANAAGVGMALVTAIPGAIDLSLGVPRKSKARSIGLIHMTLNLSALAVFAISAWINLSQYNSAEPSAGWGVGLGVLGLGLTLGAVRLGRELIATHHFEDDQTSNPTHARKQNHNTDATSSTGPQADVHPIRRKSSVH